LNSLSFPVATAQQQTQSLYTSQNLVAPQQTQQISYTNQVSYQNNPPQQQVQPQYQQSQKPITYTNTATNHNQNLVEGFDDFVTATSETKTEKNVRKKKKDK
jgi:hypothetical protein